MENSSCSSSSNSNNGPLIKISVAYGPSQCEISVPSQATFGELKEVIEKQSGLEAKRQKILFRGKEKDDDGEYLHEAGVKDKSKILLLENPTPAPPQPPPAKHHNNHSHHEQLLVKASHQVEDGTSNAPPPADRTSEEVSKALQAVARVREEVNMLAERVSALEVAVQSGTEVADEEFVVSSELLMRQLLKLDTIEAEGEAKIQRKAEVRRIQNFHEKLDSLKTSNSKPFGNSNNAVSVTTEWETFDSGVGSLSPPPVASSTRITENWERFE